MASFFDLAQSALGLVSSIAGDSPPILDSAAVSEGFSAASDVVSNIATDSGNTSLLDLLGNSGTSPVDNALQRSGLTYTASADPAQAAKDAGVSVDTVPSVDPTSQGTSGSSATGSPQTASQMVGDQNSPGAAHPAPSGAATNAPSGPLPALSAEMGVTTNGPPPGSPDSVKNTGMLDSVSKYVKENAGLVEVGGGLLKGAMTQLGPQAAKLNAEANYLNQKATEYDKTQAYNELMRQRYIDSVNGMGTKSTAIDPNSALFSRPGLINGARSA